jgi:hypothetical protein
MIALFSCHFRFSELKGSSAHGTLDSQDASARRQELDLKSAESPLMKFTTADHNKFLTGGGRDYGVFVLFTATDPAFNCQNCKYALFLHVVRFTRTIWRNLYH